jgi:hypothetical protein
VYISPLARLLAGRVVGTVTGQLASQVAGQSVTVELGGTDFSPAAIKVLLPVRLSSLDVVY